MTFIFPENNINARQQKRKNHKNTKAKNICKYFEILSLKKYQKKYKTKRPKISYR